MRKGQVSRTVKKSYETSRFTCRFSIYIREAHTLAGNTVKYCKTPLYRFAAGFARIYPTDDSLNSYELSYENPCERCFSET